SALTFRFPGWLLGRASPLYIYTRSPDPSSVQERRLSCQQCRADMPSLRNLVPAVSPSRGRRGCATMNAGLVVRKRIDVDDDLDPRRRGSVSARHDRDDRRPEGAGRLRAARSAEQGGGDTVARCFWGGVATLLVQSSSATTMTTIGLVSAGLLTFPQGLGLVFGANVGTTGTGWLIALIGLRVSLTAAALPMIFIGALIKLLGGGRVSAAGAAL